jgi:hypothetical protein
MRDMLILAAIAVAIIVGAIGFGWHTGLIRVVPTAIPASM